MPPADEIESNVAQCVDYRHSNAAKEGYFTLSEPNGRCETHCLFEQFEARY